MSLSGNLGFVSIDEVLRLLTRSRQQGSVNVTGIGLHGRVFVGKGGVDLATTSDNDELHRHLINAGYADEKTLSRVTTGETTLAAIAEANHDIVDLLREMTVESLHQMATRGEDFAVHEGATTPYASPKSFELEALLQDADERKREWHKVSELIPDLTGALGFRRDLGEREEITVKVDDWKVLTEIGSGASVAEIADNLGTTEFWTARVAARLVNNELIVLETAGSEAVIEDEEIIDTPLVPATPIAEEPEVEDQYEDTDELEDEIPSDEYAAYEAEKSAMSEVSGSDHELVEAQADDSDRDADPDQGWWKEPTEDQATDGETSDDRDSQTPAVVAEGLSEIPSVGDPDEGADVEGDTEAFLEKVFSELESTEPEVEEGHGLLRRRRMGTLRDFSSDS